MARPAPHTRVFPTETEAHLTLRSARSARLEGWATHMVLVPTLRDADVVYPEALEGAAPQGEAFRCGDSKCIGETLVGRSRAFAIVARRGDVGGRGAQALAENAAGLPRSRRRSHAGREPTVVERADQLAVERGQGPLRMGHVAQHAVGGVGMRQEAERMQRLVDGATVEIPDADRIEPQFAAIDHAALVPPRRAEAVAALAVQPVLIEGHDEIGRRILVRHVDDRDACFGRDRLDALARDLDQSGRRGGVGEGEPDRRTGMGLALLSSLRSALSSKARAASASVARDWPWADAATPSHVATNAQTRWPILVFKVTLAPNVAPRILQRRTARVA